MAASDLAAAGQYELDLGMGLGYRRLAVASTRAALITLVAGTSACHLIVGYESTATPRPQADMGLAGDSAADIAGIALDAGPTDLAAELAPRGDTDALTTDARIVPDVLLCLEEGILLSEIMINPRGEEPEGEWFELFNGSSATVNLDGWTISDGRQTTIVRDPNLTIGPGEYRLFCALQATPLGGDGCDYYYTDTTQCSSQVCLNNTAVTLTVRSPTGEVRLTRTYRRSAGIPEGQSLSDPDPCDADPDVTEWCFEEVLMSDGNRGTPRAPAACTVL
jgi:hypothetical protein